MSIVSGEPSVEEFKPGAGEGEAPEEADDESRNSQETVRTSDEVERDGASNSNGSLLLFIFPFFS